MRRMFFMASLGKVLPKCPIFYDSGAEMRLNLYDGMGSIDLEDYCGLWLILCKLHEKNSNEIKSNDLVG